MPVFWLNTMLNVQVKPSFEELSRRFGRFNATEMLNKSIKILTLGLESEGKLAATEMIYAQPISRSGYLRTGFLRSQITHRLGNLEGKVQARAPYSIYVHEGTRFMRGRPFFDKAIKDGLNKLEKKVTTEMEKSVKVKLGAR